jgi:hypothetical protein
LFLILSKQETLLKLCVLAVVCLGIEARPPVNRAQGAFGLDEVISGELSSVGFTGTWISGEYRFETIWTIGHLSFGRMDINILNQIT